MNRSRSTALTPLLLSADATRETDEDCACPDGVFGVTLAATGGSLAQTPGISAQPLPGDHWLLHSPLAPGGPCVLNTAGYERWQGFAAPRPAADAFDHQLLRQALITPAGRRAVPQAAPAQTLTAWLHITNACNLDCPYCYVRKSSARMSDEIGLAAVERLFETAQGHGFRRLKLKYAGGAATLHFRLLRWLHERAVALAETTGIALREVVLSNGAHLRPTDADWLAEAGVKLMVSLDGVGADHDRQRPLRGGGGTFALVERTVDEVLLPRGIRPDVTITLTALNAAGAAGAVRWALSRDLPVSLNFYRPNLLSAGRRELELEEQAIINGMLAAYGVFEEYLPERPFLSGLLDRVQAQAHSHTCGVQHSYVVIAHDGRTAQCQMHLEQRGDYLPLDLLDSVSSGPILNLAVDDKTGCRECAFRYRCSGGCPLETYRATGRWDVQSPHCGIYRALFPAALRLEGLRLLKTAGHVL